MPEPRRRRSSPELNGVFDALLGESSPSNGVKKPKSAAAVCGEIIQQLQDLIGDVKVIAAGRGTESRFSMIRDSLWAIQEAIRSIDPVMLKLAEERRLKAIEGCVAAAKPGGGS